MANYNELVDISFSSDGDFELENGDFKLARGKDCLKDDIMVRIMTNAPDWRAYSMMGATLEDLIGEKNTRQTGALGRDKIIHSLTRDGKVNPADLSVHTVPVKADEILYYISVDYGEIDKIEIPHVINL